jgi:hypothetical protein
VTVRSTSRAEGSFQVSLKDRPRAGLLKEGDDFSPTRPDDRERTVSVGVGFSVTKLAQNFVNTTVLDYFQIPYTYLRFDIDLD